MPGSNIERFCGTPSVSGERARVGFSCAGGQIGVSLVQVAKLKVKEVKWLLQSQTNSFLLRFLSVCPAHVARWGLLRRGRKYPYGGTRNPLLLSYSSHS